MNYTTILTETKAQVLYLSLNRPDVRNAFNADLIAELTAAFTTEAAAPSVRVVVLQGSGPVFSAGGDLNWMKQAATYTREQNIIDANKLSHLLETINSCPLPVIAKVHGAAMGGGTGLVSVADYVIAEAQMKFAFSEVKLGLIPACIGPFVLAKMGASAARALFLSGETFSAERALQVGLIHKIALGADALEQETQGLIDTLLANSPAALKTAKSFLATLPTLKTTDQHDLAAQTLAALRASPEGQEGIRAFLEKRKPQWTS